MLATRIDTLPRLVQLLGATPGQIAAARLALGIEPATYINGREYFSAEQVERIAQHLAQARPVAMQPPREFA